MVAAARRGAAARSAQPRRDCGELIPAGSAPRAQRRARAARPQPLRGPRRDARVARTAPAPGRGSSDIRHGDGCGQHIPWRAPPRAEATPQQDGAGGGEHARPRPRREDAEPAATHHRHSPCGGRHRHRGVAGPEVLHLRGGGPAPGHAPGPARLHLSAARAPRSGAPARRDTLQVPAIYLAKKNIQKQGALADYEKEQYTLLHKKINHSWDLVVMQAREQLRAAKQRRKGDRMVILCQEQTYWLVNRPPPGVSNVLEQGPERGSCTSRRVQMIQSSDFYKREIECFRKALGRNRVKSSICLEAHMNFSSQRGPHDPIMSGCLPSNPWITDDVAYWAMNAPIVVAPTKLRVERWGFSFRELLDDPMGRAHFMDFLQKEFSAENLSFWEACEELRFGGQSQVPILVDTVYQQFLAPGAAHWVNIDSRTMERTLEGLHQPHRYVLDAAQLHIYMLMKKDSYPRFLKSDMYKGLLAEAVIPLETKRRAFQFLWKPLHSSPSPALQLASGEPIAASSPADDQEA